MLKFRKGTFAVSLNTGTAEREGWVSDVFAINKDPKSRYGWVATHLPSGMRMSRFEAPTLRDVKANLESVASLNWQGTTIEEIAASNGLAPRAFVDRVNALQYPSSRAA